MCLSEAERIIHDCEAVVEGHFEYASGLHGRRYLEKARLLTEPGPVFALGRCLAASLAGQGVVSEVVCTPAVGGIPIGYATALHLRNRFVPLERGAKGRFMVRRSFAGPLMGARVVFVDDIKTTGRTMHDCIGLLTDLGAQVVHAGFVADVVVQRPAAPEDGIIPFTSLVGSEERAWSQQECELCKRGVPLVRLSRRRSPQQGVEGARPGTPR